MSISLAKYLGIDEEKVLDEINDLFTDPVYMSIDEVLNDGN